MRRFNAGRLLGIILIIPAAMSIGTLALPTREFQRWHMLDNTIHSNLGWIYERIHYDNTPIDIAFVGASRVGAGINSVLLSQTLSLNVVNFSLPMAGRDSSYAIVKELLSKKTPSLIVVGITEKPSRYGHAAFKYFADTTDVVDPGHPVNLNYLSNISYLPFRQIKLFAVSAMPQLLHFRERFSVETYSGKTIDTTGDVIMPDGRVKNGTRPALPENLRLQVASYVKGVRPPILPRSLSNIEFGDERIYVKKIAELAKKSGTSVWFISIPRYEGEPEIQERQYYHRFGPVLDAQFLARNATLYSDYGHLTAQGASILTHWFARKLIASCVAPSSLDSSTDTGSYPGTSASPNGIDCPLIRTR